VPVVFVHGVNVRDGEASYFTDLAARRELLKRLVLKPLKAKGPRFANLDIVNPYWGCHGVSFHWEQETLPRIESALDYLGPEDNAATPQSDFEMALTLKQTARAGTRAGGPLDQLGAADGQLLQAARKDLPRFVEAILAPVILSEQRLDVGDEAAPEEVGIREALLVEAGDDVANDPAVKERVQQANTDDEVVELLKTAVQERFKKLAAGAPSAALPASAAQPKGGGVLDEMGVVGDVWHGMWDRIGEFFGRAKDAPRRVVTTLALDWYRTDVHNRMTRFFGDVFVYLNKRGDRQAPGPIVSTVLDALRNTPRHHAQEPLIVITHSMGGNILYDILTYYAPDLKVDAWISVASQVGQFEEMKIFRACDESIRKPAHVRGLKPRVGYWLNVYDPVDPFGFLARPVFEDVAEDLLFRTGSGDMQAHSAYFKRPRFYRTVRARLEGALK
jgi:hypothetical protein